MSRTVQLLSDTGTELTTTGTKQKADSYYGNTDGLHTVGFYLQDFTGRLTIQGSIVADPGDDDWFDITLTNEANSYVQFTETDGLQIRTFTGNFVWVRANMDRSYISPDPDPNNVGKVRKIMMTH